jgi:hypothetical protein
MQGGREKDFRGFLSPHFYFSGLALVVRPPAVWRGQNQKNNNFLCFAD